MRNLICGICLLMFACTDSTDNSAQDEGICSSIVTSGEGVVINNSYFMSLKNGMILSVSSEEKVGVQDAVSSYSIAPVFPEEYKDLWNLNFEGNEFEVSGNTITKVQEVDNGDFLFALFDLKSGNKVMEYTYDKFEVNFLDEHEKRFLGFYSTNAAEISNSDFLFERNTFGFINYANQQGGISKIRVDATDDKWLDLFDISNPVIELMPYKNSAIELNSGKTLYFTSSDGKSSQDVNFDIQFTYYTKDTYEPSSFLLEVRGDEIIVPDNFSNPIFNLESL